MMHSALAFDEFDLPADGPDLVALALALVGTTSVDKVIENSLRALRYPDTEGAWALLCRVGDGNYRSACTRGIGFGEVRELADQTCGRKALISVDAWTQEATRLSGPHWQAVWKNADVTLGEPDLVLANWTVPGSPLPDEGDLGRAAVMIGRALRTARQFEILEERSCRDPLTGLLNRRGILEYLERERSRADRHGRDLSVLFLDLDRFKEINDRHGHTVGDEVLCELAGRLDRAIRSSDLVGRIGGDEFLVVLPDTGIREAGAIGRRLARLVGEEPFQTDAGPHKLKVTFGASSLGEETEPEDLLELADHRMLAKKMRRQPLRRRTATPACPASPVAVHAAER